MNQPESDETIFAAALQWETPAQRAAYLDEACAGNAGLRSRVEGLLRASDDAKTFLERPVGQPGKLPSAPPATIKLSFADDPSEAPGARIGRYKLLQQIGEGGCGTVFMAEQEEPVRRRVALKVIKLGMDTKSVVARFEAERQALAMMDHPNIAKVLDAGATDAGRPFFVMELVRGIPITRYCDENKLDTQARLDLFIKVCQAIQHAHQKGIIHRDIKPSNILVTLHDGVPVPKVIDFGIAKATEGRLTNATLFTAFEQFIGTPAYMSPEQAEMSGLDIDTRSDIYALGVLLYELLTGKTPFDAKELAQSGLDAMRKTIREKEPQRPSTRLSTMLGDALTATANAHGSDAVRLLKLIRGDLDWIVMKCLEKDRTRRYETANGLAADLKRHLDNEPVVARPPSAAYKFQKAYRRNRLAFTAAVIVFVSLVVALAFIWVAARREGLARVHESIQRNLAEQQRQRAEASERSAKEAQTQESRMRQQAERDRSLVESSLYASDMNLAQQELAAGNLGVASDLLDQHRPRVGRKDLRGWEWRYLWRQCRRDDQLTLGIHSHRATGLAFSPDSRLAASAETPDGEGEKGSKVLIWDLRSLKQLGPPLTEDAAGSVAFSPDGRHIAFGTRHHGVKVLETSTRAIVADFPAKQSLWAHGLAFSPDSKVLAIADMSSSITLFEVVSGRKLATLVGHQGSVTCLAFVPDGTKLVSGSWDQQVKVWDLASATSISSWTNHTSVVWGVAVSPDGQTVASASEDGTVRVISLATGLQLAVSAYQDVWFYSAIAFSPDGKHFACGGSDHSIRIWDTKSGKEIRILRGNRDEVWAVTYSPDGRTLLSGAKDGEVRVWSLMATPSENSHLASLPERDFATLSPDGRWLFELGTNRIYRLVEIPSLREIVRRPLPDKLAYPVTAAIASDGITLAYGTAEGAIGVLNAVTGSEVRSLSQGTTKVSSLKFSHDGTVLAASDLVGARIWDAISYDEMARMEYSGKYGEVRVDLARDGKLVAISFDDGQVEVRGINPRIVPQKWKAHQSIVKGAAFYPDNRTLVTAGIDARLKVWNIETQHESMLGRALNAFFSVTLNNDASRLVAGAGEGWVRIYDPVGFHQLLTLKGHNYMVRQVAFLPGENILVTLGGDGLRLWRAPSWEDIAAAEAKEKAESKQP